jgi:putative ABC transport system permease protein
MTAVPAVRAARGGLSGRRVQTLVIGVVVLISTATCALALGLLVDANAPFDHGFAAQRGAHVAAVVEAPAAAAASRVPGATAVSGPFAEATVTGQTSFAGVPGAYRLPPLTLVGRASPGGPVDDIRLDSGRWAARTGEIVVSRDMEGPTPALGQQITMSNGVHLTVVGVAKSITDTADGWVAPAEIGLLRAPGSPEVSQFLYRFGNAGSTAAITADISAIRNALPTGDLVGTVSYLTIKLQVTSSIAPWVPFIVAFGVIGLVMSVLIVVNVVSGAVVAGTRRIGVLKSIGFTPSQVVAAYVLQIAVPAVAGCVLGVLAGNLLSVPLLGQTARAFGVGSLAVPAWVDLAVPLTMLHLVGIAALLPSLRAGRLSAVQAIATGRAPRPAHGYVAHRVLGRIPGLPRPVTLGMAGPFARPTRTMVTLIAILLGGAAVTFAAGLATSLDRAELDLSHSQSEPVQVDLPDGIVHIAKPGAPSASAPVQSVAAQRRAVEAALNEVPGTANYVAEADDDLSVLGLSHPARTYAFDGDSSWTGYALITGSWYRGNGEADVNTYFLTATGKRVGDTFTLMPSGVRVRIVGEVFDPSSDAEVFTSFGTAAAADPSLVPRQYDVGLKPGTNPQAYANALGHLLGPEGEGYGVSLNTPDSTFVSIIALIATLTLLLAIVAGLGVLNTVALQIRERVHDLGVFKALGMTPRQTVAMVVCSVAGVGLVAGAIAIPLGTAVHAIVLPAMGHAAQSDIPASLLDVYHPAELVLLALSGVVIAVAGALVPAGWAARSRVATALRAE